MHSHVVEDERRPLVTIDLLILQANKIKDNFTYFDKLFFKNKYTDVASHNYLVFFLF